MGVIARSTDLSSSPHLLPSFFPTSSVKTEGQLAQRGTERTEAMGSGQVGQKLVGGRTKSHGDVELERMGGLVLAVPTEGFPFYGRSGAATVIQPTRLSGGGNTRLDNGQPVRSWRRDRGCGKRWQGDITASYGRGIEKDGVQRSKNRVGWCE
jgi:hypothetical protein